MVAIGMNGVRAWTGDGERGVHLPQQQGRRPQGYGPDQGHLREVQAHPRPPPRRTGEINKRTALLLLYHILCWPALLWHFIYSTSVTLVSSMWLSGEAEQCGRITERTLVVRKATSTAVQYNSSCTVVCTYHQKSTSVVNGTIGNDLVFV